VNHCSSFACPILISKTDSDLCDNPRQNEVEIIEIQQKWPELLAVNQHWWCSTVCKGAIRSITGLGLVWILDTSLGDKTISTY
jgi:hypothetical protein